MSKKVMLSFVCLLVLALSSVAFAQSTTTGSIGGVVNNPAKEVVAGAAVTVKNLGTNKEDTSTTDDTGRFKVPNLQPGLYSVTVNSSGFSPMTVDNVTVEIGRETTIEVALAVGPVTGTVDVTAEAPAINTVQADFSAKLVAIIFRLERNTRRDSVNQLTDEGVRVARTPFVVAVV